MKKVIFIIAILFLSISINLKAENNTDIKGLDSLQGIWKYSDTHMGATLTISGTKIDFNCLREFDGIDSEYLTFSGNIVSSRDDKWETKDCRVFEWNGIRKRRGFSYDKAVVSDDMGGFIITYPDGNKGIYIHEIGLFMTQ